MALQVATTYKGFDVPEAYIRINHIAGGKNGWFAEAAIYKDAATAAQSAVAQPVPDDPQNPRATMMARRRQQQIEHKNILDKLSVRAPYVEGAVPYVQLYEALKVVVAKAAGTEPQDV